MKYFSDNRDGLLKENFLINSTIDSFAHLSFADQQPSHAPTEPRAIVWVVIEFKDKESENYVKKQLKVLRRQPDGADMFMFVNQNLKLQETKPEIFNQERVEYRFYYDLCFTGFVGNTRGHSHACLDRNKQQSSCIYKHYHDKHGNVPEAL